MRISQIEVNREKEEVKQINPANGDDCRRTGKLSRRASE